MLADNTVVYESIEERMTYFKDFYFFLRFSVFKKASGEFDRSK